jgi:translation elongation factor EF-4
LHRIINEIPYPTVGKATDKLKLFLVNSWFVNNKNVICLFYVMSGELKKSSAIMSCSSGKTYQIFEVGMLEPELTSKKSLFPGQIGYAVSNMKQVKEARIGDTFYKIGEKVTP